MVWAPAAEAAAGLVEQRGEGGQTEVVSAPGVVCRASAGLHCLARRPDAGTRSQTLPGSTKTGTGGHKTNAGCVVGEDEELCETRRPKRERTKWCVNDQFACLCKYNFHQTLEELILVAWETADRSAQDKLSVCEPPNTP